MQKKKIFACAAVACNLLCALFAAYAVLCFFFDFGSPADRTLGATCFRYYTIDSNLFAALGCLVMLPSRIAKLAGSERKVPMGVRIFKFIGTVAVTVTMLTVVFFLGPTQGYAAMFSGSSFWLHLICPLLALASLVFECDEELPKLAFLPGVSTVPVYGTVYLILVVVAKSWPDFYGFNRGGLWPISFVLMAALATALSFGLTKLYNLLAKKVFPKD